MPQKKDKKLRLRILVLAAALIAVTGVLATVGTVAWLRHTRSLSTATLIKIPTLSLKGSQTDQLIASIGDLDVEQDTSKKMVFRVYSAVGTNYFVQLAHTTNIPLTYTIYPVTGTSEEAAGSGLAVTEGSVSYYYDGATPLAGGYLNRGADGLATDALFAATFGEGYPRDNVQINTNPLYWRSEQQTSKEENTYYVLEISWGAGLKNNKETDMIYLTVSMGGSNATN